MKRKSKTRSEQEYLAFVASSPCMICSSHFGVKNYAVHVHHVHEGWGRTSHFDTIPLCREHHTGGTGIHGLGKKRFKEIYGKNEQELLREFKFYVENLYFPVV